MIPTHLTLRSSPSTEPARAEGALRRIAHVLDPADPTPLYHQIASAIRWEVGMGRLAVGTSLPPIRELATAAGVNYHTVREAYEALVQEGVVASRRGAGTTVLRLPTSAQWSPAGVERPRPDRVFAVECNRVQAEALAVDAEARYVTNAIPWLLDGYGEPPSGVLLCSSFHKTDVIARWPHREVDLRLVDLELDPLQTPIVEAHARARTTTSLVLVEQERATAAAMIADVRALLGDTWALRSRVLDPRAPGELAPGQLTRPDELTLVAPRVWDALPWAARSEPGVLALRFRARPSCLARIAQALGWTRRGEDSAPVPH